MLLPTLLNPFFWSFLVLAPLLIWRRLAGTLTWSWARIFVVYVVAGWLLLNAQVWFGFQIFDWMIAANPNPPEEWFELRQNDGGKLVVALFFGWAHAAVYFGVALVVTTALFRIVRSTGREAAQRP
jgi:hypothetical protein